MGARPRTDPDQTRLHGFPYAAGNPPKPAEAHFRWATVTTPGAALVKRSLRHDIYLTASQNDPCSNALVEALSCGLPAVYFRDGGHPELVEFGGIGFHTPEEIPAALERLVASYEAFQRSIWVDSIDECAQKYIDCVRLAGVIE